MVNVLVLRAPGTNCDLEACYAVEQAGGAAVRVHVNALRASPTLLNDYQFLVIPGGFSYGDDVAAGKIFATQLRNGLADHLHQFRDSGKLILGICNGFQVLIKAGLLPGWNGDAAGHQAATLANNDSGKFEDRWIHLTARPGRCAFLQGMTEMDLPIAHGEGKFVCRDTAVLDRLQSSGQIVLTYSAPADAPRGGPTGSPLPYPINPNGSQADIAGICDATGRVFGLMPHPERNIDATHHPQWTRRPDCREGEGLAIFRNAVRFFQ